MGPRSRDRGNIGRSSEDKLAESLQWGRDHVIAETRLYPTSQLVLPSLQWGRDHVIAETGKAFENEQT